MTATASDAARSVEVLAERMASIPDALLQAATVELPTPIDGWQAPVVVTGIGGSEGPARLLVSLLSEAGMAVRFVPLVSFALSAYAGGTLVVFSQNLSPNARLALSNHHAFDARWLVTSVGWQPGRSTREPVLHRLRAEGVNAIVVPPANEDGMLVRVVGPAVASLIALRLAVAIGALSPAQLPLSSLPSVLGTYAGPPLAPLSERIPVVLIAAGVTVEWLQGSRWKVLETLRSAEPHLWDVLQVAHGPLQLLHGSDADVVVLSTSAASGLVERLRGTLHPERHRVRVHTATAANALAFFEYAAVIDRLLLSTLRERPRDMFDWPGRGQDRSLYGLGDDA